MSVSAIIPAYNEEKHIGQVLAAVKRVGEIADIVVVSDGSTDRTVEVAYGFGVRVIQLPRNMGKGCAMKAGLDNTSASTVLFLDADLVGIEPHHVRALLLPVYHGAADMALGVFCSGRGVTDLAQRLTPFLTGQRAVKRWVLDMLSDNVWNTGYGIEMALTRCVRKYDLKVMEVPLYGVTHAMKEEKMGVMRGMAARLKMYWEIAKQLRM
ncbi:glycosyltransferase family 2 protein [Caldicoprobacter algeriensis]|uniref:glycosyltransferase family 2 protein n=1 Tax=Caldicoprobacter algeriensis TaxID=699281 RepID=UPI00207A620D|nr:glycosyltransferase family 2 protein [Caldicoprobacter algeriensis]MCM8901178.1 glycosyltransferase family 2 protein [Caldicoprobacter algeriensis]